MPLTNSQLDELLVIATEAAIAAGEVINSYLGTDIDSRLKDCGTSIASRIVTEVDAAAERMILGKIDPTLNSYQLGLLTEETTDDQSRFEQDFFWCIDPLDGTLPFTQNRDGYSTSIALVSRDGQAQLGVVYDPRNQNLYSAMKGRGAFKNGNALHINCAETVTIIDGPGGAVMQAIATIEQAPCVFYKRPKEEEGSGCLWDYAATSIIQSEAGGFNGYFNFEPIDLNSSESMFMNKRGICYYTGLSQENIIRLIHDR